MSQRKLPKEAQEIFDRYARNNVRRLKREDAVKMMVEEFEMSADQATVIFEAFDQDRNGVMSIWEFQQFYTLVGRCASELVARFKALDKDGSGKLDAVEATEELKQHDLGEKEIEFFLKVSAGSDGLIDIGQFASLLYRLRVHDENKKKE